MNKTKHSEVLTIPFDFFKLRETLIIENSHSMALIYLFKLSTMANEFVEPSVYRYNYGKFEEMDVLITLTSIPLEELEYIKNLFSKLEIIKFDKNGFNVRRYWNKHNDRDRTSKSYKEWRDSIFKRDNYTCQSCKKRGVNLEAHHIKPWSKFKELRFDNDNGITLCTKCHKDLHKNKRC